MEAKEITVRAQINLLRANQGGRARPLVGGSSYRPNHNFWGRDVETKGFAVGIINLPTGYDPLPGETFEVDVIFLPWKELTPELYPGREWSIQEVAKLVGYGRILKVLP